MISVAKEENGWIYIFDENGNRKGRISVSADDDLVGFTSTTVSVRHGGWIYIYDEDGHQTGRI